MGGDHLLGDHSRLDTPFLSLSFPLFLFQTKVDGHLSREGWTGSCQGGICDHLQSGVFRFTTKDKDDADLRMKKEIQTQVQINA